MFPCLKTLTHCSLTKAMSAQQNSNLCSWTQLLFALRTQSQRYGETIVWNLGRANNEGNCLKLFKAPNLLYPSSESRHCLIFTYCILSEAVVAFHLLQPSFFSPSFTHPVLFIHITFRLPHIPSTTAQGNVGKAV